MSTISSIIIVLLTLGFSDNGDILEDKLMAELTRKGFENVFAVLEGQRLIVTYENGIYRHEIRAIKEILSIISPVPGDEIEIVLIPQNRGIPLFVISIPSDEIHKPHIDKSDELGSIWNLFQYLLNKEPKEECNSKIDVSLNLGSAWPKISSQDRTNASFCKCGIVFIPQYKAIYGDYPDAIKSQINLIPEFNISLWKGMLVTTQLIIPIQNQLSEEDDHLRPGLLTLNQTIRLPYNIFASATAGYFTMNRYGLDLEFRKYFANGQLCVGANTGYTGYAAYANSTWSYSHIGLLTMLFDLEYIIPQFDIHFRSAYGRFLSQDKGWRFDMFRQYSEIQIGFYGIRTAKINSYWDAGFYFRIPIFPSKHLSIGRLMIGPAEAFHHEYRYHGYLGAGYMYQTGNSIDRFIKHLSPGYIKNRIFPL